jgi:DNA (cytosine-5)-methyltransferase 1
MTFGSLFAGIGGFDLGLERAGMKCKWQVEIDPYARRILEKHWPTVPKWDDVRTFPPEKGSWSVDLICGGFPCQPVSFAGRQRGVADERWLWPEFARILRHLRPRFTLLENVPGLFVRGIDEVLGSLAEIGLNAEWETIPTAAFGSHFIGERVFIIASNATSRCLRRKGDWKATKQDVASSPWGRLQFERLLQLVLQTAVSTRNPSRISDGVSHRVDRLRCLGNAVVPQVAEWIGRRIMESYQ